MSKRRWPKLPHYQLKKNCPRQPPNMKIMNPYGRALLSGTKKSSRKCNKKLVSIVHLFFTTSMIHFQTLCALQFWSKADKYHFFFHFPSVSLAPAFHCISLKDFSERPARPGCAFFKVRELPFLIVYFKLSKLLFFFLFTQPFRNNAQLFLY